MRRYKKLFLLLISFAFVGIVGLVLIKMMQHYAQPFPGAVVVLDDAAWRSQWERKGLDRLYQWAAPDIIMGYRWNRDRCQITLYRRLSDGTAAPPQTLPIALPTRRNWKSLDRVN
jgi:hypothetical protein